MKKERRPGLGPCLSALAVKQKTTYRQWCCDAVSLKDWPQAARSFSRLVFVLETAKAVPPYQGGGPKATWCCAAAGKSFWWWMRSGSDVSSWAASEEHFSMGQDRCVWSSCSIAGRRTVLSKNQFGAHERREAVWRRASGLFPIYLFRIWLQMSPDARRFDAFDNTDGPIWEP